METNFSSSLQVETVTETSWNMQSVLFVNGHFKYLSKKQYQFGRDWKKTNCGAANLFHNFSAVAQGITLKTVISSSKVQIWFKPI